MRVAGSVLAPLTHAALALALLVCAGACARTRPPAAPEKGPWPVGPRTSCNHEHAWCFLGNDTQPVCTTDPATGCDVCTCAPQSTFQRIAPRMP